MFNSKSKLNLMIYYFFALLIIFLPLQRLIEKILLFRFHFPENLAFWTTHFYEPVIIIALLLYCLSRAEPRGLSRVWSRDCIAIKSGHFFCHPERPKGAERSRSEDSSANQSVGLRMTILLVIALIALSIFSALVLSPSIPRGLEGIRFSIFFLLAFLAGYLSDFQGEQRNKLISLYLIMAAIIAIWAIIERFLPVNYLMKLKLIDPDSCFGYGAHRIGTIWQSVTSIGGPNQLGSYLLPAIFIAMIKLKSRRFGNVGILIEASRNLKTKELKNNLTMSEEAKLTSDSNITIKQCFNSRFAQMINYILPIIFIVAIIFSFSRSAWAGLYAGFIIYLILFVKNIKLQVAGLAILIIIAALGLNYYLDSPSDILTHGASNLSHQSAYQLSVTEIKNRFNAPIKFIVGSGIGTAGPAALKYGDGFVSESWYFQLALELGILGLLLWLILIGLLLIDLYKKNQGLFLGLTAVSITAIFLHTFADNPALSITLFLLIGMVISKRPDK